MRTGMLAVALLAAVAMPARAAEPGAWAGFANAWIASHAMRVKGQAPRDRRLSCEGDVNGDGRPDVVVVYTIEGVGGGNDWTQYATVLTGAPQGYGASTPRAVGGKSQRAVEGCRIASAGVELATKEYAPSDPSCCPSRAASARYAFTAGALVDVPAPSPSAP